MKYEEKGFDVLVMGGFNARIRLESVAGCDGRWTWESDVSKSVKHYMLFGKAIEVVEMVVEDSRKLDVRLDHNLIWSEIIWGRRAVRRREWYKW